MTMYVSNTKDKSLIGAAGVHFVTSELNRRGLIALPTIRNTGGIDVVVTSRDGNWHANLQVKTSHTRVTFWPVGKSYEAFVGPRNYYAFVRFLKKENRFEVFFERSGKAAFGVKRLTARSQARGHKEWSPCWPLPREERDRARLRRNWTQFGATVCGK